jgi:membrane fusion protein, multidrug efflux system
VQRVPVKIVLDPHSALGKLVRPGMSVEATVDTGRVVAAAGAPAPPQTAGQAERSNK